MAGLGQLWVQRAGHRMVLLWPVASTITMGCEPVNSWWWLFGEGLKPKEFKEWAEINLSFVSLPPGGMLWIPFVWQMASLAETDLDGDDVDDVLDNETLMLPYLSEGVSQKLRHYCRCR